MSRARSSPCGPSTSAARRASRGLASRTKAVVLSARRTALCHQPTRTKRSPHRPRSASGDHRQRPRARKPSKVPYGATLPGRGWRQVKAGDQLATWDPHTRPIITEYAGREVRERRRRRRLPKQIDEVTGLSTLVVIDPKRGGKAQTICARRSSCSTPTAKKSLRVPAHPVTMLPGRRDISVETASRFRSVTCWRRNAAESAKTRDITGGLPRVAELFEPVRRRIPAMLAEGHRYPSRSARTPRAKRLVSPIS